MDVQICYADAWVELELALGDTTPVCLNDACCSLAGISRGNSRYIDRWRQASATQRHANELTIIYCLAGKVRQSHSVSPLMDSRAVLFAFVYDVQISAGQRGRAALEKAPHFQVDLAV